MPVENRLVKIDWEEQVAGYDITFKAGPPSHRGHLSRHVHGLMKDELYAMANAIYELAMLRGEQSMQWAVTPRTVMVSSKEGGDWVRFSSNPFDNPHQVHAIMFDNGAIWDTTNGWRPGERRLGPVTIKHPTTFVGHEITLRDYELEALIAWHSGQQYEHAKREEYAEAADHKRRREELEKMKGSGK